MEKPFTVYYYRFHGVYEEKFETLDDCINFVAWDLLDDGIGGYPKNITKDGEEILNEEEILDKVHAKYV
jgi:hypothetical protein